jgi:hypothetical protein
MTDPPSLELAVIFAVASLASLMAWELDPGSAQHPVRSLLRALLSRWHPRTEAPLEDGVVVGSIFKVPVAPRERPWVWASGHNGDPPQGGACLRADARGCDGGVRKELAALTEATATIKNPTTGTITVYRRHNKPALGPLGDSLEDLK